MTLYLQDKLKGPDGIGKLQRQLESPSIPLIPKTDPGPPKIVRNEAKYSAVEGQETILQLLLISHFIKCQLKCILGQTACCMFNIEGNPSPIFKFFKGSTEIYESGRYQIVTDGNDHNLIMFAILKVKTNDEAEYRF